MKEETDWDNPCKNMGTQWLGGNSRRLSKCSKNGIHHHCNNRLMKTCVVSGRVSRWNLDFWHWRFYHITKLQNSRWVPQNPLVLLGFVTREKWFWYQQLSFMCARAFMMEIYASSRRVLFKTVYFLKKEISIQAPCNNLSNNIPMYKNGFWETHIIHKEFERKINHVPTWISPKKVKAQISVTVHSWTVTTF